MALAGGGPSARTEHAAAFDAQRQVVVLFGGDPGTLRDTWEFNGSAWRLVHDREPRPPDEPCAMIHDTLRARCVLVSGNSPSNITQTWEWNGTAWTLRSSSGPAGRYGFALAYDSIRGRTVLFGGHSAAFGDHSDTWEWDGTAWRQRGSGGPRPRVGHAMCFDAHRGVVVLFGGRSEVNVTEFSDTWEWNGAQWVERFGIAGPPFRRSHGMAWDPVSLRTVLFGGYDDAIGTTGQFNDTWSWDGTAWTLETPSVRPSARHAAAMVYDSARQRFTLFGGSSSSGFAGDTWHCALLPATAPSFTSMGAGCPGPTGTPTLGPAPGSQPQLGSTFTMRLAGMPASPLNLPIGVLGTDNTTWNGQPLPLALDPFGFTGCQAWIAPAVSYVLTNNGGVANWNVPVPFLPALLGVHVYAQGLVVVPGWNPGGTITTNGGHLVIGR